MCVLSIKLPIQKSLKTYLMSLVFYVLTELINVSLCWLVNTDVSMCKILYKNVVYEFVLISSVVLSMSCSFNSDGL